MASNRVHYAISALLATVFVLAMVFAVMFNTDFGNVEVREVRIPDGDISLAGLLYHPDVATADSPQPAVVLTHGISSDKQSVCDIAMELARNDFVALAIDLVGHGNSDGHLNNGSDPTLGVLAAVRYLEAQPFAEKSAIGLVGHSLGAGAIRACAVAHGNITASVFIAGGLGSMVTGPGYGTLNSTFPKNLMIAVGTQDVLFDIKQLQVELASVFGAAQEVVPNRLYGNFTTQTARKLITPQTTHIFEPVTPLVVSETIIWMANALRNEHLESSLQQMSLTYIHREEAVAVSLVAFLGLVFPISHIIVSIQRGSEPQKAKTKYGILEDWKVFVIWGALGLVLFLPMFFIGFLIPIPPVLFGSSFAWWLLGVAVSGLLVVSFLLPKFSNVKFNLKSAISESFSRTNLIVAVLLFALLYFTEYITEAIANIDLRVVVPVFNSLMPTTRILMLFAFLPFFLVYFFVDGLYLHEFHAWHTEKTGSKSEAFSILKVIIIKICPYVGLLAVQYVPMFALNVRVFPTYVGFLAEFLWGVLPIFTISAAYSCWLYRRTSAVGTGAIFNALLFSWSAAAIFPL